MKRRGLWARSTSGTRTLARSYQAILGLVLPIGFETIFLAIGIQPSSDDMKFTLIGHLIGSIGVQNRFWSTRSQSHPGMNVSITPLQLDPTHL